MDRGFHNRHDWRTMTVALAVWAAHFSLLWAASVVFPGAPAARWIALAVTLAAAAALVWLARRGGVASPVSAAGLGIGIAAAGVAFGSLPALMS